MLGKTGLVILTTALPVFELRGGLPLALALGFNPVSALLLTVVVNALIFFPVFFGLKFFYENWLSKIKFVSRIIERVRRKGSPYVNKYGLLGLAFFVALPLPVSGVYSGTILGWGLGLKWKKAFLAIALGTLLAGILMLFVSLGVLGSLSWLGSLAWILK